MCSFMQRMVRSVKRRCPMQHVTMDIGVGGMSYQILLYNATMRK
jgi:hypothetical protein